MYTFHAAIQLILGVNLKRQSSCASMKCYKREKVDPFALPTSPGILASFYFSCGPIAGLGFLIGGMQGFVFAIVSDVIFWVLMKLLKEIGIHHR